MQGYDCEVFNAVLHFFRILKRIFFYALTIFPNSKLLTSRYKHVVQFPTMKQFIEKIKVSSISKQSAS